MSPPNRLDHWVSTPPPVPLLVFNFSLSEAMRVLEQHRSRDQIFSTAIEATLVGLYTLLMTSGILFNSTMLAALILLRRQAKASARRNLFLVNLNVADLSLCAVAMPFTLLELIHRHWSLGKLICKGVSFIQGACVFVSAGTVSVVALDRHRTIVCASTGTGRVRRHKDMSGKRMATKTAIVWVLSCLLAAPVCMARGVSEARLAGLVIYEKCVEMWPWKMSRALYTGLILVCQLVVPAAILLTVHIRIRSHLRVRAPPEQGAAFFQLERLKRELTRNRRATVLLLNVTVAFALTWLPWHVLNLVADLHANIASPQGLYGAFSCCHLVAMTSATINPILYGWLNTNIRREILRWSKSFLGRRRQRAYSDRDSRGGDGTNLELDTLPREVVGADTDAVLATVDGIEHIHTTIV